MSLLIESPCATDGGLFVCNLESTLDHSWFTFHSHPERPGILDAILDSESIRSQFFGDYSSLDRLVSLSGYLLQSKPDMAGSHLFAAQVNSARHLFADAEQNLGRAEALGADEHAMSRIQLSIDQALGKNLELVLEQRLRNVANKNSIENRIPLGALLADLGQHDEANDVYIQALTTYADLSPIGLAWACFQLGFLWGEVVDEPDLEKAAYFYAKAVNYLPGYTHATVHWAEIEMENGKLDQARELLNSVIESGDPEAKWRMSELLAKEGKTQASEKALLAAEHMYEDLLSRHELAFCDHASEFYLGSGNKPERALKLALANFKNRSTIRAYELVIDAADAAGDRTLSENYSNELFKVWGVK